MRVASTVGAAGFAFLVAAGAALAADPIAEAVIPIHPSITVRTLRESPSRDNLECAQTPDLRPLECSGQDVARLTLGLDALGWFYEIVKVGMQLPSGEVVDVIRRVSPEGTIEALAYFVTNDCPNCQAWNQFACLETGSNRVDMPNGRILLVISSLWRELPWAYGDEGRIGVVEITGLPAMFDTLLTFVPGGQAISAVTPRHPDGFQSVDSVQVWTGDLRSMPDRSVATPLTCAAATNPTPGQVVTVGDHLPEPAPGHGRYYLTASVNGSDRRLGRQYVSGVFSARDPASLPVCAP